MEDLRNTTKIMSMCSDALKSLYVSASATEQQKKRKIK